jgi:hypothetical protein
MEGERFVQRRLVAQLMRGINGGDFGHQAAQGGRIGDQGVGGENQQMRAGRSGAAEQRAKGLR